MGKSVYCEKYVQGSTRPAQHLAVHQATRDKRPANAASRMLPAPQSRLSL